MKHKQLVSHFLAYIASRPPTLEDAHEAMAMLYGTDEVKINYKREALRFENRGWIPVPGLRAHTGRVAWVAVIPEEDGARIVFGEGPPFGPESAKHLPTKNGRILAAPATALAALARAEQVAGSSVPEIATQQLPPQILEVSRKAPAGEPDSPVFAESTAVVQPEPAIDMAPSAAAALPEPAAEIAGSAACELEAETVAEPLVEQPAAAQPRETKSTPDPEPEVAQQPETCEADPVLRRARLPLFLLAQLRKLKVGEVLVLVNVRGPGLVAGDDSKGRAVALVEKLHSDSYVMRGLWTLSVGRTLAACLHVWSEATFKVLPSRRLEVANLGALNDVLKVLRRCDFLSRSAKRAGDRESYSHLSPQLFDAHTRNANLAPYVAFLDRFQTPA